jgi:hypothetical protein
MINGEILKAVKTARAVFHPLSKARKTELRSCFSGAFKLSGLSCNLSPVTFSLTFNQTLHRSLKKFATSDHNKS